MIEEPSLQKQRVSDTEHLKSFIRNKGIDLFGIVDLQLLEGMPIGILPDSTGFLKRYRYAIVMGAQMGKLGAKSSGNEVSLFLEKAALEVMLYLVEKKGYCALIIHTEDEFDPIKRMGLMSLKVLAKEAGLGWQGRSLLIISPEYGPIHRLIAVLTDMPLQPNQPVPNHCDDCSLCIEKCPENALTYISFADHPEHREDVLDIRVCKGDDGCKVCLVMCPWSGYRLKKRNKTFS